VRTVRFVYDRGAAAGKVEERIAVDEEISDEDLEMMLADWVCENTHAYWEEVEE
jgi:hypothetical protein